MASTEQSSAMDDKEVREAQETSFQGENKEMDMTTNLMSALGINTEPNPVSAPPSVPSIPDVLKGQVTIQSFVEAIREGRVGKIVTMAGAGISTSCGIPDFRTPGTGLYSQLEQYGLSKPEDIFSIEFFKKNPQPFCALAKEIYPSNFRPSPTHYFIRLLHEKGLLLRHYTQNIDGLESISGVPDEKLVEAHGHFRACHCIKCGKDYDAEKIKEEIFNDIIPLCTETDCDGFIKPDIVFFGEALPTRFKECAGEDFKECDMLFVMGTSLTVKPFGDMVDFVNDDTPRMLVNLEPAGCASTQDEIDKFVQKLQESDEIPDFFKPLAIQQLVPQLESGFRFDGEGKPFDTNYRDVFFGGKCDENIYKLLEMLGWTQEFEQMMEKHEQTLHLPQSKQNKNNDSKLAPALAAAANAIATETEIDSHEQRQQVYRPSASSGVFGTVLFPKTMYKPALNSGVFGSVLY